MINPDVAAFVGLVLVSLLFGVVTGLTTRAMDRADHPF
jgi:hypothetical protein